MFRLVKASARGNTSAGSSTLPADMLALATRRLILTAYVFTATYALYFLLYNTVWLEHATTTGRISSVVMTVCSIALIAYLRRGAVPQQRVANLALAYQLVVCAAIGFTEYCDLPAVAAEAPVSNISWMCVVIVWFPLVVPGAPRRIAIGSMLAATTNVVAFFATVVPSETIAMPSADVVGSMLLPPYLCALLAYAPARMLYRLRGEVSRARMLGSYELETKLGQGGMGEVWSAKHRFLVRPAAVKLIRPEAVGGGETVNGRSLRDRFEREAQTTASLASPHTVELYDFGVAEDGTFYYVMELLDGIDLEQLVKQHGPVPPARAVHILKQTCDSLDEAHRRGLVHRDVKPANIVLVPNRGWQRDVVKVLDFGLVKGDLRGGSSPVDLTAASGEAQIKGTPAYLAPEMITGKATVDGRADLYALGCVAVWLLTGEHVFAATSAMEMAIAHVRDEPASLRDRGVEVPAPLETIIARCLSKAPDDRPASAAELAAELDRVPLTPWTPDDAASWWDGREAGSRSDGPASPALNATMVEAR